MYKLLVSVADSYVASTSHRGYIHHHFRVQRHVFFFHLARWSYIQIVLFISSYKIILSKSHVGMVMYTQVNHVSLLRSEQLHGF